MEVGNDSDLEVHVFQSSSEVRTHKPKIPFIFLLVGKTLYGSSIQVKNKKETNMVG